MKSRVGAAARTRGGGRLARGLSLLLLAAAIGGCEEADRDDRGIDQRAGHLDSGTAPRDLSIPPGDRGDAAGPDAARPDAAADGGRPVYPPGDECDTTAGCQQLYEDAVDCVNSKSEESYCACGADRHICFSASNPDGGAAPPALFDPGKDLLALHYDHAPDRDDGHSAAADRTILESDFSCNFIDTRTVAVAGAYGENAGAYQPSSEAVMETVFNPCGGYLNADDDWQAAVTAATQRWIDTLVAGGDIWVKEGGQSDFTADVVAAIKAQHPSINTRARIHVVQHSDWNEDETTDADLTYVQTETAYIRIKDANSYLARNGGDQAFEDAALAHPIFKDSWQAAFDYYDPDTRLDFSDTGELMHILALGEMGIDDFRQTYLDQTTPPPAQQTIEVETIAPAGLWSLETAKGGYSGTGYFFWTGGDSYSTTGVGELVYDFNVPQGGSYKIEIRSRRDSEGTCLNAADDLCNDVFTKVDSGAWNKTLLKGAWGQWIWNTRLEPSHGVFAEPIYSLNAGGHQLRISARSRGMKIDVIRITLQ